jgi:putative DeoR family transcriptional regulator (stage III sporulation protein D)
MAKLSNEELDARVLKHGRLFIKRDANIRSVAKLSGWSKSTVEKDLNMRLPLLHIDLYEKVREKLLFHKNVRHIRGGEATKVKWNKKQDRIKNKENQN